MLFFFLEIKKDTRTPAAWLSTSLATAFPKKKKNLLRRLILLSSFVDPSLSDASIYLQSISLFSIYSTEALRKETKTWRVTDSVSLALKKTRRRP